jgi:Ca2+/H+ antiporter, TMEM165/GDT1 family
MGDKTQLLAMAFATRFRWQTVMQGVLAATLVNHFLAVVAGNYLAVLVPLQWIKTAAAISFIGFGFWTIRGDSLEGEDKRFSFSPFWTVSVAFFFAEMGDKTQLATVALAVEYGVVVPVWLGTTSGMLVADAVGIIAGIVMGKRIPERLIKWVAAIIFIGFGLYGLYEIIPNQFWSLESIAAAAFLLALALFALLRMTKRRQSQLKD